LDGPHNIENLNLLEKIQNLPAKYLEAYFLINQAKYSNYQSDLISYSQINNIDDLINKISLELEIREQDNLKKLLSELDKQIELKKININELYKRLKKHE